MFTGIQILEPRIFEYIPRGVFSDSTTDVYPQAIANGERVAAHVASGKWRELSTLQRYLDISVELLREKGDAFSRGRDTIVYRRTPRLSTRSFGTSGGLGCARVNRAVLADDVQIGAVKLLRMRLSCHACWSKAKRHRKKLFRDVFRVKTLSCP